MLLLVCILTAGWVRSRSFRICDSIALRIQIQNEGSEDFVSVIYLRTIPDYWLLHRKCEGTGSKPASQWIKYLKIRTWSTTSAQDDSDDAVLTIEPNFLFGLLLVDEVPSIVGPPGDMDWILAVPFWLCVIPLALLSTLLLLSKPRPAIHSSKPVEVTPQDGP